MDDTKSPATVDYQSWTHDRLVGRIAELEKALEASITSHPAGKKTRPAGKPFDPTKYSSRFIALKFAYLGKRFNGFEHSGNTITPLPTIEEELWKALMRTRLIFPHKKVDNPDTLQGSTEIDNDQTQPVEYQLDPLGPDERLQEINWTGCNYSKCGRTDKGVSSFGQVVGIVVRSNRPKGAAAEKQADWHHIRDEIPYIHILNQALPPQIRVLAWCPSPPADFSARFSCRERQYKYFFTQPSFLPLPNALGCRPGADGKPVREGWLDLDKMREAAAHYIGKHDFRNFSKVDPVRQMTDFTREVFHVGIEEVSTLDRPSFLSSPAVGPMTDGVAGSGVEPKLYAFCVNGSAFLYHQVRHMVGMLFTIGQGLEEPTIIKQLLDVDSNPRKPNYEMASDVPLVLWDCVFPDKQSDSRQDALEWVFADAANNGIKSKFGPADGKWGQLGLMESLWTHWRSTKMEETLAGLLLDAAAFQGTGMNGGQVGDRPSKADAKRMKVFDGGDAHKSKGKHVPVMKRDLLDPVDVINARWAAKKAIKEGEKEAKKRTGDAMSE